MVFLKHSIVFSNSVKFIYLKHYIKTGVEILFAWYFSHSQNSQTHSISNVHKILANTF